MPALTAHFSLEELDGGAAPPGIQANLLSVANWLEAARAILGVPLTITSGYRTADHNAQVGGSSTSDHVIGLAADFEARGLTPYQVYQQLQAAEDAGTLPAFDQLIYYVADNHVHVGLGRNGPMGTLRGQVLLATTEGSYVALAGELVTRLRGYV